jgi:hypothetical protein
MTEMYIGIHVYRGITETVVTGENAQECRELLMVDEEQESGEYQPNPSDDDLQVFVVCEWGCEPCAAYKFTQERWIGEGCPE